MSKKPKNGSPPSLTTPPLYMPDDQRAPRVMHFISQLKNTKVCNCACWDRVKTEFALSRTQPPSDPIPILILSYN